MQPHKIISSHDDTFFSSQNQGEEKGEVIQQSNGKLHISLITNEDMRAYKLLIIDGALCAVKLYSNNINKYDHIMNTKMRAN